MTNQTQLYEQDVHAWAQTQVQLLRQGQWDALDIDHLILELEDMGKSHQRELASRLIILIAHLLKWEFQRARLAEQWREFEGKSWRNTIIEQRLQLALLLNQAPSLKSTLAQTLIDVYPTARQLASKETDMSLETFPETCPYALAQVLDEAFYPATGAATPHR
jgi:hypothetical protein